MGTPKECTTLLRLTVVWITLLLSGCGPGTGEDQATARNETPKTLGEETSMSQADQDRRIDYVEFSTSNMEDTKRFYSSVFGWTFTDYGPDYASFSDGRLSGGFTVVADVTAGGPLVVVYVADLEGLVSQIEEFGGRIVREVFEFPGGRRFHFADPSGNELAAWSDQ
jgi:predicted enzyme related to lactoylglutathione lyase